MDKQQELEAYLDLFLHPGWKQFIDAYTEILKNSKDQAHTTCLTGDQWQFQRGAVTQLEELVGFEQYIRAIAAQMEQEGLEDNV